MIKQIFTILLIVLMLTMNIGVTLSNHYCGGELVKSSISLDQDQLSCGMTKIDEYPCNNQNSSDSFQNKDCCENTFTTYSIEDNFNSQDFFSISKNDINFIVPLVVSFVFNYFFIQVEKITFVTYSPPFIEQDKSVLFQVFQI